MTKKTLCLSALAVALLTSVSACSRGGGGENLVQVQMSEASYQNLYGANAVPCDPAAGQNCE